MNTITKSALSAIVVHAETVAVALEAPVDTADRSAEATRCSGVVSRLADVSVFAVVTFEQPFWSCSTRHRATGTKSSRS
jgi:hypothetical protein